MRIKNIIRYNYCEHSWVFDKSRSNYSSFPKKKKDIYFKKKQ